MSQFSGRFGRLAAVLMLSAVTAPPVSSQEEIIDPEAPHNAVSQIILVTREFEKLGEWHTQMPMIESFLDDVYEENGWNTESDKFSKQLALEVARIPPWRFELRMEKMTDMLSERYGLTPPQVTRFRSNLYRETFGLFLSNAPVLANQTREFVSSRLNGQPLTVEQVARWTRESKKVVSDAFDRMDFITGALHADMTDQQRKILDRDRRSWELGRKYILKQRDKWARGEWSPKEWGLADDPIQNGRALNEDRSATPIPLGTHKRTPANRTNTAANPRPAANFRYLPQDESTWEQYVREFIHKHGLDAGQRTAIESILSELVARAEQYRQTHRSELEAVPASQRAQAVEFDSIRRMFEELKARAEALLTTTQQSDDRS